ncbi:MAG: DUF58 domain-containing protein [Phycisphaerae bacterium]|nr:DUF58 domain-containing protein [Phycisphaerae bacterium]
MPPAAVLAVPTNDQADHPRRLMRLRPMPVMHVPAAVFILTTLLLPVGAINGQNNLLFWIFGLAIATLVASGTIGAWTMASLVVERDPVSPVHVGEVTRITYRITNRSRVLPAFAVSISELSRRPWMPRSSRRPDPTWDGKLSRGVAFAEFIPCRGTVVVHALVAGIGRGMARLDTAEVWTTFPFGLSRKTILMAREQAVLVRPRAARLSPSAASMLSALLRGENQGASTHSGTGDEFHSLRDHSDGDPPGAIAWKRTATTGRLLVRQNARMLNRRVMIGIADLSRVTPAEAERTIAAAAGLVAAAAGLGLLVGLLGTATRDPLPPRLGSRPLEEVFDALARLDPSSEGPPLPPPGGVRSHLTLILDPARGPWGDGSARVLAPGDVLTPGTGESGMRAVRRGLAGRVLDTLASLLPVSEPDGALKGGGR